MIPLTPVFIISHNSPIIIRPALFFRKKTRVSTATRAKNKLPHPFCPLHRATTPMINSTVTTIPSTTSIAVKNESRKGGFLSTISIRRENRSKFILSQTLSPLLMLHQNASILNHHQPPGSRSFRRYFVLNPHLH